MTFTEFFELESEKKLELLQTMCLIRSAEEKINCLNDVHAFHGTNHLCIGQEASNVGLCAALNDSDYLIATHRGHGMYLAKCRKNINAMMFEMFGLYNGMCKGLGGSMHFSDMSCGYVCSTGVVAAGIPIAAGIALGLKYNEKNSISVVAFGDGASNQGMAFESLNLASYLDLPLLFFCENNQYAVSSPSAKFVAHNRIYERVKAFGLESVSVDGNKLDEVYNAVCKAKEYILSNRRPYFIESETYRQNGHSRSDALVYRTREEEAEWRLNDPIKYFAALLQTEGVLTEELFADMLSEVNFEVENAVDLCNKKKNVISFEEAQSYVYAAKEGE